MIKRFECKYCTYHRQGVDDDAPRCYFKDWSSPNAELPCLSTKKLYEKQIEMKAVGQFVSEICDKLYGRLNDLLGHYDDADRVERQHIYVEYQTLQNVKDKIVGKYLLMKKELDKEINRSLGR